MYLLDVITPRTIKVPLDSALKRPAIEELVDVLAHAGLVADPDSIKAAVWEREQQRSTGIGEGLAIPHGKCECVDSLRIAIGVPKEPIEFDAIDRRPVRMIALLASPPDKTSDHIQALGKISRVMSRADFRNAAYEAQSSEELYQMFEEAERAMASK